jgi:hypothetical protein
MATITRVKVRFKNHHVATFKKHGSKESLCKVTRIKVGGHSFMGRRGGRALCGPSTGKNSPDARAARAAFKRTWGGRKHRKSSRRRSRR